MQVPIVTIGQESGEKEEKTFGCCVVSRTTDVGATRKDILNPLQRARKAVALAICVEQGEDVDAYDGVKAGAAVVEVCLAMSRVSKGQVNGMEGDRDLHDAVRVNVFHHLVNDGQSDLGIPAKRNNADGGRVNVIRELSPWEHSSVQILPQVKEPAVPWKKFHVLEWSTSLTSVLEVPSMKSNSLK